MKMFHRQQLCIFTTRKRSLRKGNIFARVCHSVHGGGVRGCRGGWRGTCVVKAEVFILNSDNRLEIIANYTGNKADEINQCICYQTDFGIIER